MKLFLTILTFFCACFPINAQSQGAQLANSFVIRNARIFNGKTVSGQGDVWIQDGYIKAVGNNVIAPAGLRVIDATGNTLLPGLIDSHTHDWGDALKRALIFGVTTQLDMFSDPPYAASVKQEQANGKDLDMADLRSSGFVATAPGGHGTEYGVSVPTLSSPSEAQAWVDARIAEGSDYIKIIYTSPGRNRPTLSIETIKALIDAAHKRGKLAIVHIDDQQEAKEAINAGADGLAHLFPDSAPTADFAALVAAHHAFVIPTLTVLESVSAIRSGESLTTDPRLKPFLTQEDIAVLRQSITKSPDNRSEKYAEDTVRELTAAHVPVLAGTDCGNAGTSHGVSIHRELELLVRSGMTPEQAVAAATSVPARVFHLDDRGEIAPGKRADLLLVKGDPTRDITATRDIVAVWKVGVQDDREAYRTQIAKQTKTEHQPAKPTDIDGTWMGTIDTGTAKVRAVFHIRNTEDGLIVTLDDPNDSEKYFQASLVTRNAESLRIELNSVGGAFEGKMEKDITTIDGMWRQAGKMYSLVLKRVKDTSEPSAGVH
jgi:imidazolonepropionase-like amidohydrolase